MVNLGYCLIVGHENYAIRQSHGKFGRHKFHLVFLLALYSSVHQANILDTTSGLD